VSDVDSLATLTIFGFFLYAANNRYTVPTLFVNVNGMPLQTYSRNPNLDNRDQWLLAVKTTRSLCCHPNYFDPRKSNSGPSG